MMHCSFIFSHKFRTILFVTLDFASSGCYFINMIYDTSRFRHYYYFNISRHTRLAISAYLFSTIDIIIIGFARTYHYFILYAILMKVISRFILLYLLSVYKWVMPYLLAISRAQWLASHMILSTFHTFTLLPASAGFQNYRQAITVYLSISNLLLLEYDYTIMPLPIIGY